MAARLGTFHASVRGIPDEKLDSWFRRLYTRGRSAAAHKTDFSEDERDV
jgi:hypothetical protein